MKKLYYLFTALVFSLAAGSSTAQDYGKFGSQECVYNLNIYNDYFKAGNFNEALPPWRKAFKACPPGVSHALYANGITIFKQQIEKNKENPALKSKLIDSVFMMYDLRSKYFPSKDDQIKYYKALDAIELLTDDRKVLDILEEAIKAGGNRADPVILVLTMSRMIQMYDKKMVSGEEIMEVYSKINPIIENHLKDNHPKAAQAKRDIDLLFANSGVANCENIVRMFTPEFEANPNDKELVSRIVRLLSDAECFKEDLFLKTVETLHNLDPSYKSAEYLYKLYSSRGEDENAIKMLREAIDSEESTDAEDADYLITLASFYFQNMKNLIKASEAAKEAMSKNPAVAGKAYMILGSIWTQVTCGGDDIQQRSKWWVAVDYFTRAKNADASLAEEAQKHIDTYYQYFPLKEDAFIFGLKEGDSYTVSCNGLSAVTRVRTRLK